MKLWGKKQRIERYAGLLSRWESRFNARLRRVTDYMRVKTDSYSERLKWTGLIVFILAVSLVCSIIIYNVFK